MSNHDQMLHEAERMRNTFKDLVDQPNDGTARQIHAEIEGLISDLRVKRDGRSIENRLKSLEQHLHHLNPEVMDFQHSNLLAGQCEDMRRETRSL